MPDTLPLLLSPEAAAEQLGCGRSYIYTLLASGDLRSIKIGRLRRIPRAEVARYIGRQLGETRPD